MFTRLRQFLVLAMFAISAMIYLRTSLDEISKEDNTSGISLWNMIYLTGLALFAGSFEASEIYDHLFPQQLAADDNLDMKPVDHTKTSLTKKAVVATTVATLAPPLVLCAYAHKLQGDELASTLGVDNAFAGMLLAAPQLSKFFVVTIPHLIHTLNGTREKFSLSVTHNENVEVSESPIPPLKWWLMLSLLIYLHMPEGMLIASPIRDETLKWLAAFGFAFAESLPHLNQLEQLPHNIASLLKSGATSSKAALALRFGAGTMGGLGSASEALMAAFVGTRNKATAWIAPLVEFVLGFAETQQHLVPSLEDLSRRFTLFRPAAQEKKIPHDINHNRLAFGGGS